MYATRQTARIAVPAALLTLGLSLATTAAYATDFVLATATVADRTNGTFTPTTTTLETKSADPSKSVGNSYAGGDIHFPIQISNQNGCRTIKISAKGTVKFLKQSGTAAEVEVSAKSCDDGTRKGSAKAKLAGFSVAVDESSVSFSWEKNFSKSLISASTTVWVGPVPVTLKGSVAGTLSAKILLSITSNGVGLSGPLSASMKGTASGSVGLPGYNLGLEAVLELLKTTLTPLVNATKSALSGSITICFEPIIIKLNLKASLWPFSYTHNLANYSAARECKPVLSL